MPRRKLALLLLVFIAPLFSRRAALAQPLGETITTPQQLINAVNALRAARGLAPLAEHPALMQSAQAQANYMASTGIVTHERPGATYTQQLLALGFPLAGDLSLGGFRSENILSSGSPLVWDGVPAAWQDELHMNTMLSVNYTHIGAGIAQNGGMYYYAVDTAAATGSGQMQEQAAQILTAVPEGANITGASQYIIPVSVSTALPNGDVYHVVEYGQTLWAIAIQYNVKIKDLQALNNLGESAVVQQGEKLLVMRGATQPAPAIPSPTLESAPSPTVAAATPFFIPTPILVSPTPTIAPPTPTPSASGGGTFSSPALVAVLILAALVGGGMAVWLIREPN